MYLPPFIKLIMLIIAFGLPGSGKSFFAQKLSKKINAVLLSSDRIRKELISSPHYSLEDKNLVYETLLKKTEDELKAGRTVIVDATFYLERWRKAFWELSAMVHVPCYFLEIVAQESLIKKRVSKKRPDSDADYSVYLTVKALFMPMTRPHLVLESKEGNIEQMLAQAIESIFGNI